ncbi:MAG: peptide ABC transporter substrate-binding protein [Candidatus Flexifilum sp.]
MKNRFRVLSLLIVVALALALVGGVIAQDELKVLVTGRQMGASDIPTIDPSLAEDVPSVQVISQLFVELLRLDEETAVVENGMASYTVSDDGLVYTFSILPEVPWVRYNAASGAVEQVLDENGNPRYVTAGDFVYGILRSLDPNLGAPYSYVIAPWIAGASAYNSGEGAAEDVGVRAIDDYTLELTVARASSTIPSIVAMWPMMAQPAWVIDEQAEFWIDPENINTYGPFALKEWVRGDGGSLTMIANPFWPGTDNIPQPKLDEVVFRFLDEEQQLTEFEAGNLQVSEAPSSAIDRIMSDPALSAAYAVVPGSCTYYYGFNVERPPFDDARVRRAFSMAIDRQAIVDNVTQSGEIPARFFALPSLNAAPQQDDFPELGIYSDPEMAQQLWNEYLTEVGKTAADFAPVLFHNESSLHSAIAQAVQEMWANTLGVNVTIQTADFATYLDTRGNYDVYRAGWCFDYPDAHNFYYDAGFHSDLLEENDTHWSNPEYDALIDQGLEVATTEERVALYAQAEDILVNQDAAIAPIYYYVSNDLTAPNVVRTHSIITREYYENWDLQ